MRKRQRKKNNTLRQKKWERSLANILYNKETDTWIVKQPKEKRRGKHA